MSDLIALLMNAAGGNEQHAAALATARIRELEADLARVTAERDEWRDIAGKTQNQNAALLADGFADRFDRDALAAKLTRCEGLLREARLDWIKVGYDRRPPQRAGAAHMTETDRATLLHAAELLESEGSYLLRMGDAATREWAQDMIATARALREMAG